MEACWTVMFQLPRPLDHPPIFRARDNRQDRLTVVIRIERAHRIGVMAEYENFALSYSLNWLSPEFSAQNPFYEPDHLWAQPKRRHTADLMREVFDHQQESAARGRRAREEVQRDWDNQRAADMLMDCAVDYFEAGVKRTMAAPVKTRKTE